MDRAFKRKQVQMLVMTMIGYSLFYFLRKNFSFAMSTTTAIITTMGILWVVNGYFQSMGFAPCSKLMAYWVPPGELATKQALWNTSHSVGAGLVTILCGYIMGLGELGADGVGVGMWRWCFWGPAAIVAVGLLAVYKFMPGLPREEGFDDLKETEVNGAPADAAESGVTASRMVSSGSWSSTGGRCC